MSMFYYAFVLCFTLWLFAPIISAAAEVAPPGLLLAETYQADIQLTNYLVSEKYDGVRAYWDGRRLVSRGGNVIQAPYWFTRPLPDIPLDGELWIERGRFDEVSGIVRRHQAVDAAWREVRYMVFDLPKANQAFEARYHKLQQLLEKAEASWIETVVQFRVTDHAQLSTRLQDVVAQGGEGLMLHHRQSYYEANRSEHLLKLKPLEDAEAVVIAHVAGKGKYTGMLGALRVKTPDGRTFYIGTGFSDQERREPPSIGSTVTYQYSGLTKHDLPRFARFLRVRDDL